MIAFGYGMDETVDPADPSDERPDIRCKCGMYQGGKGGGDIGDRPGKTWSRIIRGWRTSVGNMSILAKFLT